MYPLRALAMNGRLHSCAAIKRCVEHGLVLLGTGAFICACFSPNRPERARKPCLWWGFHRFNATLLIEPQGYRAVRAISARHIIERGRAAVDRIAAPSPVAKICLQRAGSEVGVEVPVTSPCPAGPVEVNFDVGTRCKGPPDMPAIAGQRNFLVGQPTRVNCNGSFDPVAPRRGHLVDIHDQFGPIPMNATRTDGESVVGLLERAAPAIGHGPAPAGAVCSDVYANMVVWAFAA